MSKNTAVDGAKLRYLQLKDIFKPYKLVILSSLMVILSGPVFDWYLFGWISLVPLFFAVRNLSYRLTFKFGFLMLFLSYWAYIPWVQYLALVYFNIPFPLNYLAPPILAGLTAPIMGLALVLDKFVRQRLQIPIFFSFPVFFTLIWTYYPVVFFTSFSFIQFPFKIALQPIEILGIEGLDFILVMSNCLIYYFISEGRKANKIAVSVAILLLVSWFSFGTYKYYEWDALLNDWQKKKIAVIQPNRQYSSSLQYNKNPVEMGWTEKAADQGASLAIWPEGLSIGFEKVANIKEAFIDAVKKFNMPIIISDIRKQKNDATQKNETYVSSIFISPDKPPQYYYKNTLVPFGEYIPWRPVVKPIMEVLNIELFEFTAGTSSAVFEGGGMRLVPRICYEALYSSSTAQSIGADGAGKVLVFQSQNIWYGSFLQTKEHLRHSQLRGIENRTPTIHVINNGPSEVSTPHGEILLETPYYKGGYWLVDMPYSPEHGGTFFSRNPNLFKGTLAAIAAMLIAGAFLLSSKSSKKEKHSA